MTSGNFQSFPVSQVYVVREERQRRELLNIDELANSIQRTGLINPPVVERDGKLIAGERRWTAIKQLGWTHMPVQFADELSELDLQLIELEENVRRDDLPWQDQCRAVDRYHRLKLAEEPKWTQADTAEALGFTPSSVAEKLNVVTAMEKGDQRVLDAPKYSVAKNIVARTNERAKASVIAALKEEPEDAKQVPLLLTDFNEWAPVYGGEPFNFIHCDFPYGVNADGHAQGKAAEFGGYADGFDVYKQLLKTLDAAMDNVVAESAHLMFWFSMDYYQFTFDQLSHMGWKVNPFPLVWWKNDNSGILPDPARGPRRVYETAFMASRGDRKVVQAVANVASGPVVKRIHMSEKNETVLRHFFRMFVDQYSTVLDPTAGSAGALRVARTMGASSVLGLERDPEFFNRAKEAFFDE